MGIWLRHADGWIDKHRPWVLLATAVFTISVIGILDWLTDAQLFRRFFFPAACKATDKTGCDPIAWKDLFQAAVVLLGLPAAFWLWHWRDKNVRDQIENSRKDINLKEFQDVQMRAAGALDEKLPEAAREQLQIAALHQLRGFLRGDYGEAFQRPAFELLLAGHAAAIHRIGVPEVQSQARGKSVKQIQDAIIQLKNTLTPIDITRMLIIRDESPYIFLNKFPLDRRRFDLLDLRQIGFLEHLDFKESHFFGTDLSEAYLRGAKLSHANLQGSNLMGANLTRVKLEFAELSGALMDRAYVGGADLNFASLVNSEMQGTILIESTLTDADLSGAQLIQANLLNARLRGAQIYGANLSRADLRGADLGKCSFISSTIVKNAVLDSQTVFDDRPAGTWPTTPEDDRRLARQRWLDAGAIFIDDRSSSNISA